MPKYTPAKVIEFLNATDALNVTMAEADLLRARLTDAENALMAEGWKNFESATEMRGMVSLGDRYRAALEAEDHTAAHGIVTEATESEEKLAEILAVDEDFAKKNGLAGLDIFRLNRGK